MPAMVSMRTSSTLVFVLILATVVAAAAGFWWLATHSESIAFLPEYSGAQWIVAPVPLDLHMRPVVRMDTVFRRRMTLDTVPAEVDLRIRAFREIQEVRVNGHRLDTGEDTSAPSPSWRRERRFVGAAAYLQAGDNDITVTVVNDCGPPALWFQLQGHGCSLGSDAHWDASCAGAAWRPARPAGAVPRHSLADATGDPSAPPRPTTINAIHRQWPTVAAIGAVAAVAVAAAAAARRRWGGAMETEEFLLRTRRRTALLTLAVVATWVVLCLHNRDSLPADVGFDVSGHVRYLRILLEQGRLPLAEDGWQTYQPPLFYLLAAAVLKLNALAAETDQAHHAVRMLTMAFGIAQVLLVFGCVRQLFPDHPRRHLLGLVLAATLPVHLYLYQYVTNEGLAAVLITASLYVTLRIVRTPDASWRHYAILGVCLGGAMLAKFSALIVLPVIFVVLIGRLVVEHQPRLTVWARTIGLTCLIGLLVCGWHFARVWVRYGRPIVGNWDPEYGRPWWQAPGCHTADYYLGFGRSLVQPLFAGLSSFADAIYSTFWTDGFAGGNTVVRYGPPWNWELMTALSLPAMVLVIAGVVGLAAAVVRVVRQPTAAWMLVLGTGAATLLALIYMTLRLPYYGQAKAFYGMGAVVPIVACIAWGLDLIAGRRLVARTVLWWFVLTLGGCAVASFWIRNEAAETHRVRAALLAAAGRTAEALPLAETAVRLDPDNPDALFEYGRVLAVLRKTGKAEAAYRKALQRSPGFADCRVNLAILLNACGDLGGALEQTRLATEADPDCLPAWQFRSLLLIHERKMEEAVEVLREALRVNPYDPLTHRQLAAALEATLRPDDARRHHDYAERIEQAAATKARSP
jgi:tetratricopeptide (TPR) repeat protein